jgi:hypothetical protein
MPSFALVAALLPGAILSAWYVFTACTLSPHFGFPLDDSWIHAQFARNLATGRGFTYTGGQWVSGSTAPGWTVLLALGYLISRNIVVAAVVLGVCCQLAAGYYAARLTQLLGVPRSVALLAGTCVVITPVMVWGAVSGMEVTLAAALVLAGLDHHFRRRKESGPGRHVGMVLLGMSALARPESLAIIAIVLVGELFGSLPLRLRATRFVLASLAGGLPFLPLVVFSYVTIGHPLPTTFYAKSGPGIVRAAETRDWAMAMRNVTVFGPRAVRNFGVILLDQLSWGAWLSVLGLGTGIAVSSTRRATLTLLGILIFVPYAMGLTAPQRLKPDNVRYAAQLVVLAAPLVVAGAWRLSQGVRPAMALGLLVLGLTAWRTEQKRLEYAQAVKNIQELHVVTARWISAHVPPDAIVAVNDVGAMAYFSGRRVLDLEGLVSPEVLPYRLLPDRATKVVAQFQPDYLVIFPHWYPDLAKAPEFREVQRVSITDNLISAGDTLVIYETPWARR